MEKKKVELDPSHSDMQLIKR